MKWLFISMVRFYKMCLSPLTAETCIYTPTCSAYTIEAIEKHGVFKGIGLGILRVLRCVPWAKGGIDPVPDNPKGDMKWLF
ncbi:MAG: membrane protein insertion efficiency factor YidD [Clostridiales bacterium]|jgi:putative membrane protein insertion efficiency factor|nr:membrane protein insertion efficiency factor YidD [Clostridiales bacterium]